MVRLALVGSVMCLPPVKFQISQVSIGAEEQVAGLGLGARAGHIVQQPADLGAGEVGGQGQTGLAIDQMSAWPASSNSAADAIGARVLPDDGVVDRLARCAVPEHGGLALVGDADGGDVIGRDAGLGQGRADDLHAFASQISSGSCSTQPLCGKICSCSRWS